MQHGIGSMEGRSKPATSLFSVLPKFIYMYVKIKQPISNQKKCKFLVLS